MRIVVAPDSFKGALTAAQAAAAIADGVRDIRPDAETVPRPMADGGEGTVEAVLTALDGRRQTATVADPLGRPVEAGWGWVPDRRLAVIEMAAASGLPLLADAERDPTRTTTFGTGQLIAAALDRGAAEIVIGLGGSATVDAGTGILAALGARLLDADGRDLEARGGSLRAVARLDTAGLDPRLRGVALTLATDVTNPLLGPDGAARVFGPQKGLAPDRVDDVEAAMAHFAGVVMETTGRDARDAPGSGAAGGIAFLLRSVLDVAVRDGIALVAELAGLGEAVRGADLVVTGEGKLDSQSLYGKVPVGVARIARNAGVPAAAFAGAVEGDPAAFRAEGLAAVVPLPDRPMTLDQAMAETGPLLRRAAARFMAALELGRSLGERRL